MVQHLQNVHEGFDGLFKKCDHPEDLTDRPWLEPGLYIVLWKKTNFNILSKICIIINVENV